MTFTDINGKRVSIPDEYIKLVESKRSTVKLCCGNKLAYLVKISIDGFWSPRKYYVSESQYELIIKGDNSAD